MGLCSLGFRVDGFGHSGVVFFWSRGLSGGFRTRVLISGLRVQHPVAREEGSGLSVGWTWRAGFRCGGFSL